jgi:hypothetical protein
MCCYTIYRQYQNCQNIVSTKLGLQRLALRYCCHSKNGQRFANNDWAGLSNVLLPTVIVHSCFVIATPDSVPTIICWQPCMSKMWAVKRCSILFYCRLKILVCRIYTLQIEGISSITLTWSIFYLNYMFPCYSSHPCERWISKCQLHEEWISFVLQQLQTRAVLLGRHTITVRTIFKTWNAQSE